MLKLVATCFKHHVPGERYWRGRCHVGGIDGESSRREFPGHMVARRARPEDVFETMGNSQGNRFNVIVIREVASEQNLAAPKNAMQIMQSSLRRRCVCGNLPASSRWWKWKRVPAAGGWRMQRMSQIASRASTPKNGRLHNESEA